MKIKKIDFFAQNKKRANQRYTKIKGIKVYFEIKNKKQKLQYLALFQRHT